MTLPPTTLDTDAPDPAERLRTLLREAAARLRDAQNGYSQAAAHTENHKLRLLFRSNAEVRDAFAAEIAELRARHNDPDDEGMTTGGTVHVLWNSIREAIGANDTERIIRECERWENAVIQEYELLLDDPVVPPDVKETLGAQKAGIMAEIGKLRRIRLDASDSAAASNSST